MWNTPLYLALRDYIGKDMARLHMPGHKGAPLPLWNELLAYDVTEVKGTDSLYVAAEAIAQTEARYSALYGTGASCLSAGGSTLCIQAMLAMTCPPSSQILAGRNAHTAAVNAMALLDLHPHWLYPQYDAGHSCSLTITPEQVEAALAQNPKIRAVYLTSPSYYGQLCDIAAIARICHHYGAPLLVDNAHGAHLHFLSPSQHPIALGADMCCDSLHKTLPVLTGGAVLHLARAEDKAKAKHAMSLFGSTSPSYLIMLSADTALPYLEQDFAKATGELCQRVAQLRQLALQKGFALPPEPCDPARLTLGFGAMGYTKEAFDAFLRQCGIEPEYLSENYCVLLPSPFNKEKDWARIKAMLEQAQSAPPLFYPFRMEPPEMEMTLREALFSPSCCIDVENAEGRIAAAIVAPCPPGIPVVLPGEKLTPHRIKLFLSYGVHAINVIR